MRAFVDFVNAISLYDELFVPFPPGISQGPLEMTAARLEAKLKESPFEPLIETGVFMAYPRDEYSTVASEGSYGEFMEEFRRNESDGKVSRLFGVNSDLLISGPFLWSTGVYFAYSDVDDLDLLVFPSRSDLMQITLDNKRQSSARNLFERWFLSERIKICTIDLGSEKHRLTEIRLPPTFCMLMERCKSSQDVIPELVELRKHLTPLRIWLRDFDEALRNGNLSAVQDFKKDLELLSKDLERIASPTRPDSEKLKLTFSLFGLNMPLLSITKPRIGKRSLRTTVTQLALTKTADRALAKLLSFLAVEPKELRQRIHRTFRENHHENQLLQNTGA